MTPNQYDDVMKTLSQIMDWQISISSKIEAMENKLDRFIFNIENNEGVSE